MSEAAPELWSNVTLSAAARPACRISGCFVGGTDALNPLLDAVVKQTGVRPTSRLVQAKDYLSAMQYFSGSQERQSFVATSRMLSQRVSNPDEIVSVVAGQTGMDVTFDGLGGAVSTVEPQSTAFWHRKALSDVQIYSSATERTKQARTEAIGAVASGLARLGVDGGYVNYIDPALPDWANAYYGGNLPRLKQVAQAYDPHRVFGFAQSVQSS